VKLALDCPAAIATLGGALNGAAVLNVTVVDAKAALFRETVHVAEPLLDSVEGEHPIDCGEAGLTMPSVKLAEPAFNVAVSSAD